MVWAAVRGPGRENSLTRHKEDFAYGKAYS